MVRKPTHKDLEILGKEEWENCCWDLSESMMKYENQLLAAIANKGFAIDL